MEKRECRRGRRRRQGLLAIGLSVFLSGCLAVTLVCLELRRNTELAHVFARVTALELEAIELKKQIAECHNATRQLVYDRQNNNDKDYYEDEYGYYDTEDNSYDFQEDEEDEPRKPPGKNNKTHEQHRHHPQPHQASPTRVRRAIPNKYNLIIEQFPKPGQYPSKPAEVKARIYVEKDAHHDGREEQVGPPATEIRYPGRGWNYHYNGHDITTRRSRVMVTESSAENVRYHPTQSPGRIQEQVGPKPQHSSVDDYCKPAAIHVEQKGGRERGNGQLNRTQNTIAGEGRRLSGVLVGQWDEVDDINDEDTFVLDRTNHIVIRKPGVYYVYAQVYFMHTHDKCGFVVLRNSERVAECTATSHHARGRPERRNSCYTGRLIALRPGDRLSVERHEDTGNKIRHDSDKSFFGVFRVS